MKVIVIGCNNDREAVESARALAALRGIPNVMIVGVEAVEESSNNSHILEYKQIALPDIPLIDTARKSDSQPWSKEFKNKNKFKKR